MSMPFFRRSRALALNSNSLEAIGVFLLECAGIVF
jgi:hypothetical protein